MEIRTATVTDAEALLVYATALFAETLPGIFRRAVPTLEEEREFIGSRVEPTNSTMLVAVEESAVIGLLDFVGEVLAEERHVGTLGLSVDRRWRGKGVGTELVEALLVWAPTCGVSRIQIYCWENNPGAMRLYERIGFEREGVLRRAVIVDGEAIDVVLLARSLDS